MDPVLQISIQLILFARIIVTAVAFCKLYGTQFITYTACSSALCGTKVGGQSQHRVLKDERGNWLSSPHIDWFITGLELNCLEEQVHAY